MNRTGNDEFERQEFERQEIEQQEFEQQDQVLDREDVGLEDALKNFRMSVKSWSDAEFARPRTIAATTERTIGRRAAAWALACALVVGGISGELVVHQHNVEQNRIKAANAQKQRMLDAQRQQQVAELKAKQEDELLSNVDSDVSREVPSAMDPLAQLMSENESQTR
jgi:uncharacterized protein HemX